jgi:hypothetical protein
MLYFVRNQFCEMHAIHFGGDDNSCKAATVTLIIVLHTSTSTTSLGAGTGVNQGINTGHTEVDQLCTDENEELIIVNSVTE